jgi:hypothetical protein
LVRVADCLHLLRLELLRLELLRLELLRLELALRWPD